MQRILVRYGGQHNRLEQLQCIYKFYKSLDLSQSDEYHSSEICSLKWRFYDGVEKSCLTWCSKISHRCSLRLNLVTVKAKAYNLHHFHRQQPIQRDCVPVGGDGVIVKETIPISIKLLSHRIKVISRNNFVWIYISVSR